MFLIKRPNVKSFDELNSYLQDLEYRIEEAFRVGDFSSINLNALNVAPDKPRNGDLVHADGSNWNPGSGEGVYFYTTSYTKL